MQSRPAPGLLGVRSGHGLSYFSGSGPGPGLLRGWETMATTGLPGPACPAPLRDDGHREQRASREVSTAGGHTSSLRGTPGPGHGEHQVLSISWAASHHPTLTLELRFPNFTTKLQGKKKKKTLLAAHETSWWKPPMVFQGGGLNFPPSGV